MEFRIIGLGRMGANLARQAVERGIQAVGFSRNRKEDLLKEGI
jgi:6-phosphogluconate dehydrogenase (decarboxylating)